MIKELLKYALLVFWIFALSSCSTYNKFNTVYHYGQLKDNIQNITLFSTMIGKIKQPVIPVLPAVSINEQTNSIAGEIMDLQVQNIDKFREIVASSLKRHFKCEVKYGISLHSMAEYQELKEKTNNNDAPKLKNKHFPYVVLASNDFNPFELIEGDAVQYFSEPQNYKLKAQTICQGLNTDILAVSFSRLSMEWISGFIGGLHLDTYLFLFDRTGNLFSQGHAWSMTTLTTGSQILDYKQQFDNLSFILEPIMFKLSRDL